MNLYHVYSVAEYCEEDFIVSAGNEIEAKSRVYEAFPELRDNDIALYAIELDFTSEKVLHVQSGNFLG